VERRSQTTTISIILWDGIVKTVLYAIALAKVQIRLQDQ